MSHAAIKHVKPKVNTTYTMQPTGVLMNHPFLADHRQLLPHTHGIRRGQLLYIIDNVQGSVAGVGTLGGWHDSTAFPWGVGTQD